MLGTPVRRAALLKSFAELYLIVCLRRPLVSVLKCFRPILIVRLSSCAKINFAFEKELKQSFPLVVLALLNLYLRNSLTAISFFNGNKLFVV